MIKHMNGRLLSVMRCTLLVMILSSCEPQKDVFSEDKTAQSPMARQPGNQVGNQFLDFSLDDQNGDNKNIQSLIKDKPSVVFVYSGCCGHCQDELKKLVPFIDKYKNQEMVFVGVQWMGNSKICLIKAKELNLTGTVLADSEGKASAMLGVGDFILFVVDQKGMIRYRGAFDEASILQALK